MNIIQAMAETAVECARTPGYLSIWSPSLGRYVCQRDPEYPKAKSENGIIGSVDRPTISAAFKLVFLTAAGGTLLFVVICVLLTVIVRNSEPNLIKELNDALLDPVKVGFGAVVGLLGGQNLKVINPN
jgi:hypothetical protein